MPGGVSAAFEYNTAGRLVRATGAGAEAATVERVFGYDPAGRITTASGTGGTNTFAYDDRDLLTSTSGPSGTSSFTYTGDGALASRTDAAGTTDFRYDTAGRLSTIANPTAGVGDDHRLQHPLPGQQHGVRGCGQPPGVRLRQPAPAHLATS